MSHSVCDVYLAPLPETLPEVSLYPPERALEVQSTCHEALQRRRYWGWKLLQTAAERSFGVDFRSLHFEKTSFGKWTCDRFSFSLSYTEGTVAVAVSDAPVGIDLENIRVFQEKFQGRLEQFLQKITVDAEKDIPPDPDAALSLWTAKESVFKLHGTGKFVPEKISVRDAAVKTRRLSLPEPAILSLCGESAAIARYFLLDGEVLTEC